IQIAEVLRDLCRNIDHINCNFSERKLFESAQERFVTEVAILEKKDPDEILENLTLIIKTCKNT
ncbi:MAG: CarD family transcriptional regulator, partial [Acetobacter sp.]|nr:CarD family transcriptional regulator [Acetobacter sp.]